MWENIVDTAGYVIDINVVLQELVDIKSLNIQVKNKDSNTTEFDTTLQLNGVPEAVFKIVKQHCFDQPGEKEIVAIATSPEHGTLIASLPLTLIKKTFVNTAPQVTVTGMKTTPSNMACTLTVSIRDDSGQISSTIVEYRKQSYVLDARSQFVFTPISGFIGEDTVTFIVSDNYNPPFTTRKSVYIPVVAAALTPPDVPGGLKVSSQTTSAISLVWEQSVSALSYAVYRSASVDKNFTKLVDSLTSTAFTDKLNDTTWYYYVVAKNAAGVSEKSNIVSTESEKTVSTIIDSKAPVITLVYPSVDTMTVSATSINVKVNCVDETFLDSVNAYIGITKLTVTADTGNEYTIEVKGLVTGENKIDITAKDKSGKSTPKTITIYHDPTLSDNVKPGVTMIYPDKQDIRVLTDTVTIKINCTDQSGIADVKATRAGVALATTAAAPVYSVKLTALTAGKSDTVLFTVIDKSTTKNATPFQVIIRYNRVPSALVLAAPLDGTIGVTANAALSWIGGVDPDGDPVTYTVKYGTLPTALNNTVTAANTTGTTLSTLSTNTKYYWMVVAKTAINGDSVESSVNSFTTAEDKPVIIKEPENQYVVTGNRATFTITAQGNNLKYQWYRDTILIPEATGPTYSTPSVTVNYDSIPFRCIVSNDGGSVKSIDARVFIKYTITYMGNGNTGGIVPVDGNLYTKGESAAIKKNSGNLTSTGYMFGGWNTKSTGTGVTYNPSNDAFLTLTTNVILYAYWIPVYTITFDGQGATNEIYPITKFTNESSTLGTLPSAPSKTSYIFAGWWTLPNGAGIQINEKTVISASGTIYAKWEIRDVDGNLYTEVKLGDQVWMVENLKVTKYRDKIPLQKLSVDLNYSIPGYCWYNNDSATYKEPLGALYNWNVIDPANSHKIAPDGWHVPSDTEWTELVIYLSNNGYTFDGSKTYNFIGKSLAATTLWDTENGEGKIGYELSKNNKSGFSAYPSGKWFGGEFCCIGKRCYWWSSSLQKNQIGTEDEAKVRCLDYYYEHLETTTMYRWSGASIRCLRD